MKKIIDVLKSATREDVKTMEARMRVLEKEMNSLVKQKSNHQKEHDFLEAITELIACHCESDNEE